MLNNTNMDKVVKTRWEYTNIDQLNVAVNSTLKITMFNERSRRWQKVVECYKHLLWMIDTKHLPKEYEPPASYDMFLYEIFYHLGVAYQHVGKHRNAIKEFTNAIDMVSVPKNGCLAGCMTNTCLMTPLYTRRAYAYAKLGDYSSSQRDAEKAVVLDSRNPDVYCIRAMVESTASNIKEAQKDVDIALHLKPNHQCALILNKNLRQSGGAEVISCVRITETKKQDSESYLRVSDFNHPCVLEFYDKFLVPLSVPHTLTQVDLTPDKPSKILLEKTSELNRGDGSRPSSGQSTRSEPFRCGTPTSTGNKSVTRRRYDYGNALRKHLTRRKTAVDYFAQIENDRKMQSLREESATRKAISAMSSSTVFRNKPKVPTATETTQPEVSQDNKPIETTVIANMGLNASPFTFRMPNTYTIQVYQDVNIKQAPRMYYKPWKGDKLPVADVKRKVPVPAFY